MQNKSPRYHKAMNIVDVLEGSQFAKIMQKGLQINETNEKLRPLFPAELLPFLRFGNISNQTLFIEAANAMVRQSILFQQACLLTQKQTYYPDIQRFEIKINPNFQSETWFPQCVPTNWLGAKYCN